MRIFSTIVGAILILLGGAWTLQGANILKGSAVMSGQSQWIWYGLGLVIVGLLILWSTWRRRS